jgi:hypothetical protein
MWRANEGVISWNIAILAHVKSKVSGYTIDETDLLKLYSKRDMQSRSRGCRKKIEENGKCHMK